MNQPLRKFFLFSVLTLTWLMAATPAHAASLIRDTEIEQTLRDYSTPLLRAANLTPENVRIFIVNDPAINAFVFGGSNIFIHTGLILAAEDPSMLIGVIAHEIGHIAGGHLARGSEAVENAQISSILGYVLGAAAAIGGGGEAGGAIMRASQQLTQRNLLSFTRMNEQSADQAALNYLDSTDISASGLLDLMEKLRTRETIYKGHIDAYAMTHPLSKERIAHIRGHLLGSKIPEKQVPNALIPMHQRMVAKLKGFLEAPDVTLNRYPQTDQSVFARYARAIAYHRQAATTPALKEIDSLLAEAPNDPYYIELKGQILAESGLNKEALSYYHKTTELLPDAPLLSSEYGRLLLAQKPPKIDEAQRYLKKSSLQDPTNGMTWQLLGQSYSLLGEDGQSSLAYAEAAMLSGSLDETLRQLARALEKLPKSSPARLRAEDLQAEAIRMKEKQQDNKPLRRQR